MFCSLTDHLLGAVTGHPGNPDEEVLELKGWEDTAARGLRPRLFRRGGCHPHTKLDLPSAGQIKALLRSENSDPGTFYI